MQDLSTTWLECDPGPIFKPETFALPSEVAQWVGVRSNFFSIVANS